MEKEWDLKQAKKKKILEDKLINNFVSSSSSSSNNNNKRNYNDDDGDDPNNEFNEILAQQDDENNIEDKVNVDEEENFEIPDQDDETLPFACFLCRETFQMTRNPIITLCGHYFCSECIISHGKKTKTSKCPICDKQMYGVFNRATKLLKKLASDNSNSSSSSSSSSSSYSTVVRSKPRSGFVEVDDTT